MSSRSCCGRSLHRFRQESAQKEIQENLQNRPTSDDRLSRLIPQTLVASSVLRRVWKQIIPPVFFAKASRTQRLILIPVLCGRNSHFSIRFPCSSALIPDRSILFGNIYDFRLYSSNIIRITSRKKYVVAAMGIV